ncbi:MAG: hypothetical protein EOQ99_29740, partial [Mesorhizobium sp.]
VGANGSLPSPCGEGLGVGVHRRAKTSAAISPRVRRCPDGDRHAAPNAASAYIGRRSGCARSGSTSLR